MEFVDGNKKKMCLWFKGNEESERWNAVNSLPFKGFPLVGGYENLSPRDLTFGLAMVTHMYYFDGELFWLSTPWGGPMTMDR